MLKNILYPCVVFASFLSMRAVEQRSYYIHGVEIVVCGGDITRENVDVIVNAANSHMMGGDGVDGAIQQSAGHELMQYSKAHFPVLGVIDSDDVRCPGGNVKVTPSFNLSANGIRFIFHANGPRGLTPDREKHLASCYAESINAACNKELLKGVVANDNGIVKSIAFPAISVGIFGYPLQEATECAVKTIIDTLSLHRKRGTLALDTVKIVLYEQDQNFSKLFSLYAQAFDKYIAQEGRTELCLPRNKPTAFQKAMGLVVGLPIILLSNMFGCNLL